MSEPLQTALLLCAALGAFGLIAIAGELLSIRKIMERRELNENIK